METALTTSFCEHMQGSETDFCSETIDMNYETLKHQYGVFIYFKVSPVAIKEK